MAVEGMTLEEVIQRAYHRAIPPAKAIRLLQSRVRQGHLTTEEAEYRVGAALLAPLAQATPPALALAYLSEALTTGALSPQSFVLQLLFRRSVEPQLPMACLASISSAILSTQWATTTTLPFPSVVTDPWAIYPPDIGTSASATGADSADVSTLKLLLPLLQSCADSAESPSLPLLTLLVRILSSLEPYPAPPLEVGLEASGLLPQLPEVIGAPLRACLGGLMSDLAISQTAATLNLNPAPAVSPTSGTPSDIPPLPSTFPVGRPNPPIPLSHMISFILTYALSSAKSSAAPAGTDPSGNPQPFPNHLMVLRAGRYLAAPDVFLLGLIDSSLQLIMGTHQTFTPDLQRSLLFVTEWLPGLLRYWKDTSIAEWPYSNTLAESLSTTFEALAANLTSLNTWISSTFATRTTDAESSEDGTSFSMLEGWQVESIQAVMMRRMVELDLLDRAAANLLLPGVSLDPSGNGESILSRISSSSRSSLLVYEAVVASAPGAARALSTEFVAALSNSQQLPLPDNLLSNLSSHPSLLMALTCVATPEWLLSICVSNLLDAPIDEAARADDPQGVLTRYGEGVVFVEVLVDVFELSMPGLLARSRRSVALGHLEESQKACLNGWVKALFSSEGIDDHILLSTMPRDLCWLAPSIIHQAIAATAAGRLDRDTLHGGLSYFSQPLLSWCLGGIISWLCSEVIRNGLISALHLEVLQTIVLSDSTPETLLRINGRSISHVLDPQGGLSGVFQSANFDATAMKAKLDSISSAGRSWNPTPNPSLPLNIFRSQLYVIRHLSMTQHPWPGPFLADFEDCLVTVGPTAMLDILCAELLQPTLEFDRTSGDPLEYFGPLICALAIGGNRPMVEDLLSSLSTRLSSSDTTSIYPLCALVKASLLLHDHLESPSTDSTLSDRLVENLVATLSQGDSAAGPNKKRKRKLGPEGDSQASTKSRVAVSDAVKKALAGDEELRERWSMLS